MKSSSLAIPAAMHSCILPAETLDTGKGSYTTTITGNFTAPPAKIYRTINVRGPVPTNDWGGKSTYETWFSNAPHCKTGINLLPIHGGPLYLGRYPAFVQSTGLKTCDNSVNLTVRSPATIPYRQLFNQDQVKPATWSTSAATSL